MLSDFTLGLTSFLVLMIGTILRVNVPNIICFLDIMFHYICSYCVYINQEWFKPVLYLKGFLLSCLCSFSCFFVFMCFFICLCKIFFKFKVLKHDIYIISSFSI